MKSQSMRSKQCDVLSSPHEKVEIEMKKWPVQSDLVTWVSFSVLPAFQFPARQHFSQGRTIGESLPTAAVSPNQEQEACGNPAACG